MYSITLISSRSIPFGRVKMRACLSTYMHVHTTHVLFVYWETVQKLLHKWKGGRKAAKSVKDRLHAQRTDRPSTHTWVLICWPSCDEKPPLTHLGRRLPVWDGEAKTDKSIKLQQLNELCVFMCGRRSEKRSWKKRKAAVWVQRICVCVCGEVWNKNTHTDTHSHTQKKKKLEKVLKGFTSGSTRGLNP